MSDRPSESRDPAAKTPDEKPATVPRRFADASTSSKARRSRQTSSRWTTLFRAIGNVVSTGLIIYLTYYFTVFFSKPHPSAPTPPASATASSKAIEELRAEERKLLTTYGQANAVTKAVRVPIDRAMNLVAAESNQPPLVAPAGPRVEPVPTAHPAAGSTAAPKAPAGSATLTTAMPSPVATVAVPTPAPASPAAAAPAQAAAPPPSPHVALGPSLIYRAVCQTCHDVDGKGGVGRKAMPTIPDFTDAKWQVSRSDADLLHSMQEGKGQFMLPMKDKFALARTNAGEMLAFVRAFQPGGTAAAPGPAASASSAPAAVAVAPAPGATAPTPASAPVTTVAPSPAGTSPAIAMAPAPSPGASTPSAAPASTLPAALPGASAAASAGPSVPAAPLSASNESPDKAAKLRVAADYFNGNCMACHGNDGKGSVVRGAMPAIPDFTSPAWQTSHGNSQMSVSILEGKGVLMPAWRGRVSPELAADLVAYVRKFGPPGLVVAESSLTQFAGRFRDLRKQWDEIDSMTKMLAQP
jgi:mono/diheme cytochrome c family protein